MNNKTTDLRKPGPEDIAATEKLLREAKEREIGSELAGILKDMDPDTYGNAYILAEDYIVKPNVGNTRHGKETVLVYTKLRNSGFVCPKPEDIDELHPQFRRDMVCQIWNELIKNSKEN